MQLDVHINLGNAAFVTEDSEIATDELTRLLRIVADRATARLVPPTPDKGNLLDINGTTVGTWELS